MATAKEIDGLPRCSPESRGVKSEDVLNFLQDGKQSDVDFNSFMLYREGAVISEFWWQPYRPERRHMMHSITKSFLSVAIGMAVEEGYFSLQDKVISFFPEYLETAKAANENPSWVEMLTVEDLLTQTSGHGAGVSGAQWRRITTSWVEQFFKIPIVHAPGTFFKYTSATSFLLSAIIQRATGQSTRSFLTPRLFQPLGITGLSWDIGPEGINPGGNGISCRTSDLLKLAILHLQKGIWEGRRLVGTEWIAKATNAQRGNEYGYHWWMGKDSSYYAYGIFGQFAYVFPEHNAILVITSSVFPGEDSVRSLVWRHFPAIFGSTSAISISDNLGLQEYLRELHVARPSGSKLSPNAASLTDKLFVAKPNADHIEAFALDFEADKCAFHLWDHRGLHRVDVGLNQWFESETTIAMPLLHHGYDASEMPVAAWGCWSTLNTFNMVLQFVETAFQDRISIRVIDDKTVFMERGVNVNSFATKRHPVIASILDKGTGVSAGLRVASRVDDARKSSHFTNSSVSITTFPYSTTSTSIQELLENADTRAILNNEMPKAVADPRLATSTYGIRTIASHIPEITSEKLDRLDEMLGKVAISWS